ncbi:NUDIX hydrolase [Bradyrhizobium sp. CCGUVB1N3]|uniref:NUDIX hydrolase n=1 Tax=Bradyrhizobium sp. CCGUVB1N3 TaxID=2949629 RepID=UPI0020B1EFC1|nr:NUDIX hydrolase [Bradyrhizobium sp. CCGUVB1N3]MCP3472128.1 NUDIX hydrolase [Bradyrhizobium sp. CCGUVB1N3]
MNAVTDQFDEWFFLEDKRIEEHAPLTDQTNPWQRLNSEIAFDCPYYLARRDTVLHRSGKTHPYVSVRMKFRGVTVLPIDEHGFTTIIGQFRYTLDQYTWECVRGGIPIGIDSLDGAKQELLEESGYQADKWLHLFDLTASPGVTDEMAPCFIAWQLREGQPQPAQEEAIAQRRIPFSEAVRMCLSGEIVDAASMALILGAYSKMANGELPNDLLGMMRRA